MKQLPEPDESLETTKPKKLPLWRKAIAAVSAIAMLWAFWKTVSITDLSSLINSEGIQYSNVEMPVFWVLIVSMIVFAAAISRKAPPRIYPVQIEKEKRKLPKRTVAAAIMIIILIPVTIFVGIFYLNNANYYLIATLILIESMLPFALIFEGRKPQARELVVIAVLCAIAVAGRAVFFMLPNFKPVLGLVIISGVALGGETGFLVGAMSMLVSNMMFGQGPWTPYQMFAMGIIGFLAGILFRKGVIRRTRGSLCIFGALATVIIYGGIHSWSCR